jgi:hypothetical protein
MNKVNQRDKAILSDLGRFRMLDRDQIIAIHFSDTKQQITNCNRVLNRLALKGLIKADRSLRPYRYFLSDYKIKMDGQKSNHYMSVADCYIDMLRVDAPTIFEVEPKLGDKGTVEPDVFTVWRNTPFFIEVQRTVYTKKVMAAKMKRYEEYYETKDWKEFTDKWPVILIISDHKYSIDSYLTVKQSKSFSEFTRKYLVKK